MVRGGSWDLPSANALGNPSTVGVVLADVPRSGNLPQDQRMSHRIPDGASTARKGRGELPKGYLPGPMGLVKPGAFN